MELLRDLRMKRAGYLLEKTDLPVKRVAELVGFASRSAFTRAFEANTGQSPRDFRALRQDA
jgi:transcriptional regulator GlxA family with amidase domain